MLGSVSINKANPTQNFELRQKNCPSTQRATTILFTQSPVYLSRTEAGTSVTEQKTRCLSGYVFITLRNTRITRKSEKNEKKFFPKERPKNHNFIPLQSSEPYINARERMRKRDRKSEFMYCKVLSLLLPHPLLTRSSEPSSGSPPTFSLRLRFLIGHPRFK